MLLRLPRPRPHYRPMPCFRLSSLPAKNVPGDFSPSAMYRPPRLRGQTDPRQPFLIKGRWGNRGRGARARKKREGREALCPAGGWCMCMCVKDLVSQTAGAWTYLLGSSAGCLAPSPPSGHRHSGPKTLRLPPSRSATPIQRPHRSFLPAHSPARASTRRPWPLSCPSHARMQVGRHPCGRTHNTSSLREYRARPKPHSELVVALLSLALNLFIFSLGVVA